MTEPQETVRAQQKKSWDDFAGGWDRWAGEIAAWGGPVTAAMREALDAGAGDHVLDIASGVGEPALSIAEATGCRYTLTDLSPNMVDLARAAAERRGVEIVEGRACGGENLPFEDDSFDALTCRWGIMFMPDDLACAKEMRRVVKPGGRVVLSVWNTPQENPWAVVPMGIIGQHVEMPPPNPDAPGIFRHGPPGKVEAVLEAAGLTGIESRDVDVTWRMDSVEDMWGMALEMAAPIAGMRARADAAGREAIDREVIAAMRQYEGPEGVRVPGRARVVSARA